MKEKGLNLTEALVLLKDDEMLNENILLEKRRLELLSKSRKGASYKNKKENRWNAKAKCKVANTVKDYNKIDMDSFWKKDNLKFGVKVQGETDTYIVTVEFNNILPKIEKAVKDNNNLLELKLIYKCLVDSLNSTDIKIDCTCPDFKYRMAYVATQQGYKSGQAENREAKITNPEDKLGAACKHVLCVLNNADWVNKIASVINNYIAYAKDNLESIYSKYIFPKLYGLTTDKAIKMLNDEDETIDSSEELINLSNALGRLRGRIKKGSNKNPIAQARKKEAEKSKDKKKEESFSKIEKLKLFEAISNFYQYNGPAYDINDRELGFYKLTTYAKSEADALNKINFRIKSEIYADPRHRKIYLDPSCIRKVDNKLTPSIWNNTNAKYCDNCGRQLTTVGECPLCDLGDESVLEESFNNLFEFPHTQKMDKALSWLENDGYKLKVLSLDKIRKDNDLDNIEALDSYHQRLWDNVSSKDIELDFDKIYDWNYSDCMSATIKKNGKIAIDNGLHRCRALINMGYDSIEIPTLELDESYKSNNIELGTAGYIADNGELIVMDEYHGEDPRYTNLGYPEYSNTHAEEDTCVRIYKEPNEIQYKKLEEIIDKYLDTELYCKLEIWENNKYNFYKVYSLVDNICQDSNWDELVGNWTGKDLISVIKNYYKK